MQVLTFFSNLHYMILEYEHPYIEDGAPERLHIWSALGRQRANCEPRKRAASLVSHCNYPFDFRLTDNAKQSHQWDEFPAQSPPGLFGHSFGNQYPREPDQPPGMQLRIFPLSSRTLDNPHCVEVRLIKLNNAQARCHAIPCWQPMDAGWLMF